MGPILVIDDDKVVRLVLCRTLRDQGYTVCEASNGREGLEAISQDPPALIICDWLMPDVDGLKVCQHVKSDPELARTFFILLTSRTEVEDRIQGLDNGADDFLAKPIDPAELMARVRAGLRLYESSQKLQELAQELQQQKQALEAELADAAEYVCSLLPPPSDGAIAIDYQFIPSSQLGGDFLDYYWIDADHLLIYLLDVSGHGLKAALLSVAIQNLLRSQSLYGVDFYSPDAILTGLNSVFDMEALNYQYFTIWLGLYNPQTRILTYASAGHPPALLVPHQDPGTIQELRTKGMPVAMWDEATYVKDTYTVQPGDIMYLFSDGIYEFHQANGELWSLEGFKEVIASAHHYRKPLTQTLISKVAHLNPTSKFDDDRSLLQIQFS